MAIFATHSLIAINNPSSALLVINNPSSTKKNRLFILIPPVHVHVLFFPDKKMMLYIIIIKKPFQFTVVQKRQKTFWSIFFVHGVKHVNSCDTVIAPLI